MTHALARIERTADLRMQLTLRALVDDMIREGWQVDRKEQSLIVWRDKVRKEIRPVGNWQVVITL